MEKRINIFISGSTNPNISKEYKQAAIEFGKLLDTKKHNIIFDGCHGLPSIVASQLSQPNDNLIIAYTTSHNIPISDWPLATRNGTFSYQSEVPRALLDWSDVAVFFNGGSGTLAELFHAIDTKKNGEHHKPILILNIKKQWDELLKILEPLELSDLYNVMNTPKEIIEYINKHLKINQVYNKVEYLEFIKNDDYER